MRNVFVISGTTAPRPWCFARHTTSAEAVRRAGIAGLQQIAAQAQLHCRRETFHKILAWAEQAPPDAGQPLERRRILAGLDDDRLAKTQQILGLERDLAHLVVATPYVLLPAIPGLNVVSAADRAGNHAELERRYVVYWPFAGFDDPIQNLPGTNLGRGGDSFPFRFSLGGYRGPDVLDSVRWQRLTCDTLAPLEPPSTGAASVSYNATHDRYTVDAATDKAWGGTCRSVVIRLRDGSEHGALFQFTK
jgi:hypothetical protein